MGILKPITPGGLFPLCPSPAEADALDGNLWAKGNHPSFGLMYSGDEEPPGLGVLKGYHTKGYAARYSTLFEAERQHGKLLISPLGNLTKEKDDGSLKHRIIQDLRRGGANLLAELFERVVLPRPNDHGWDMYNLWKAIASKQLGPEASVWSLIVDFEDAFMSTGTLPEEQRFTAAQVDDPSSDTGSFVYVWHTLGFGGKTFPLVYARPASFASRSAQALLDCERALLQLYVDDPALALVGTKQWALEEASLPILWWLVLGLKLSWKKGSFGCGDHVWIGVLFGIGPSGPTMELPPIYLEQTLTLLKPLCIGSGTLPVREVQSAIGKAARIGYIVPDTSPYIASLWGGYAAGRRQAEEEKPGTSKHKLPVRRFSAAAQWLSTLLEEALNEVDFGAEALRRTMSDYDRGEDWLNAPLPTITFDASPWGGGGILWRNGVAVEYTYFGWSELSLDIIKAAHGDYRGQTAFEFLTLFVVAATFSDVLSSTGALIRGDNLGSLNVANGLRSTTPAMNAIAREIAWRRIIYKWRYKISHLPAEWNDEADALSRLEAEPRRAFPKSALSGASFVQAPLQDEWLWRTRLDL